MNTIICEVSVRCINFHLTKYLWLKVEDKFFL